MKSQTHKVLHKILGVPMIDYVLEAVQGAGIQRATVVVGNRAEQVQAHVGDRVTYALQDATKGWGTAKATMAAMDSVGTATVFVILADSPLITANTLAQMHQKIKAGATAVVMTAMVKDPTGYGRIKRDEQGMVCAIVEEKDASEQEKSICEINSAVLCCDGLALQEALLQVKNENAKGEYYLTDVISILYSKGKRVETLQTEESEGAGVNDLLQLVKVSTAMQARINHKHMLQGVCILQPEQTYIGPYVRIGADTTIYPNCYLMGNTSIGSMCTLLPNCRLEDTMVEESVRIENSVLVQATVGTGTTVGPFAYVRPGSVIGKNCRIGDFVEIKNATIGDKTKVSHLAYVGDADLGKGINVSCGVVFSNYDGKRKHRAKVGDQAFIGCNVNLVAPLTIGEGAYIAAGTTVCEDVPKDAMAIGRSRATLKLGWVQKRKQEDKL